MSNVSTPTLSSSELGRSPTVIRVNDENFNIQSTQRRIMIRRLKKALLDQEVPVPFWAIVQLCDLEKLESFIQIAYLSLRMLDILADLSCGLPFMWTLKPSPSQLDTALPPTTFSPRQHITPVAIYAARERDGNKCVITGTRKVYQTVPIFPTSLISSRLQDDPSSPTIWRFADMFWGQSRTQRWRRAVFNDPYSPQSFVNDCSNLICLRRDIRSAWTSGLFALRPVWISEDMTEMELEFYWQPKPGYTLHDAVDLTMLPISSKNVDSVDKLVVAVGVRGEPSYGLIKSGHRFRMTTDDPVLRPLPNFDLLDMQWHFNRLISLSAAGSLFDDNDEDYDDSSSMTTETKGKQKQPAELENEDEVLDWINSPFSSDSPGVEYVEDIRASMIGPLPGSDINRSRNVSQDSRSLVSSASAASPVSSASAASLVSAANPANGASPASAASPVSAVNPANPTNGASPASPASASSAASSTGSSGSESSESFYHVVSQTGHLSLDFLHDN